MHHEIIHDIIKHGSESQMEELKDVLIDLIDDVKKDDKQEYKAIEIRLYHILYGDKLCEKYAKEWVKKLERNDGGTGEKWSVEQTESVRQNYAPQADKWEWYAVLNSIYSDYYHEKFDNTIYYQLAKDFITDKDAVRDKVLAYYMYIVG